MLFQPKKKAEARVDLGDQGVFKKLMEDYIVPGVMADMKERVEYQKKALLLPYSPPDHWVIKGPEGTGVDDRVSQAVDKLRKEITDEIKRQAEAAFGCLGACQHMKNLEARVAALTVIVKEIYNRSRDEAKD